MPDAPRRSPAWRLAPALLLPVLTGCPNVSPFLDRHYVRAGAVELHEEIESGGADASGPFPGASAAIGTLLAVERTRSVGVEAEFQLFDLRPGTFDGVGYRGLAGARWHWNLDGRVRPTAAFGASWTDFQLDHISNRDEPAGPGGWADAGVDWMITPTFGIGTKVRGTLRYEEAAREHGARAGLELALQTVWRF